MKEGDKVKFINQKLEGVITKVHSPSSYEVEIDDGFSITASSSEIVSIEPKDTSFFQEYISNQKINQNKKKETDSKPSKQSVAVSSSIDLHIEKLISNHKSLDNSQIISIQLNKFQSFLQQAIQQNRKEVTVIHGIGKGKLKTEIHQRLKGMSQVKEFYTINDHGATKVIFV